MGPVVRSLRFYAILSVLAAVLTIVMKGAAYALTGSTGLLSDTLESLINLLAALTMYFSIWYASRPADANHAFGHDKIEFFASGLEGGLIIVAGLGTIWYGIEHLRTPTPLEQLGIGSILAAIAATINGLVAWQLVKVGRARRSPALEADGWHLFTDLITTIAVLLGLMLVALTGNTLWDPLLAVGVGLSIIWTGFRLMRRSFNGLMDHALPTLEQEQLRQRIRTTLHNGTDFHAVRTRRAGQTAFLEFHLLVPGQMTVDAAHTMAHTIEAELHALMPGLVVTIHIEPIDDQNSWEHAELRRLGERVEPLP